MKLFCCQHCGQVVYFENIRCERCGLRLGYLPESTTISALRPDRGALRALAGPGRRYRFCANAALAACNWLVPDDGEDAYCRACRHNRIIPDIEQPERLKAWRKLEAAKHRLFYSLLRLDLPLDGGTSSPRARLIFDVLADPPRSPKVMSGHKNGVITIALAEADDVEREKRRQAMGEAYRTLLGHFRHEVGHYFWDILVSGEERHDAFRALFGDERKNYDEALAQHYANGAPADWRTSFVSAYAASHPWEDFAETWAHYLHIVDTLETAYAFGMEVTPRLGGHGNLRAEASFDPYTDVAMERLIDTWLPVSFALNSLNEAMGHADVYPFILSPRAIEKLGFVHRLVHSKRRRDASPRQGEVRSDAMEHDEAAATA